MGEATSKRCDRKRCQILEGARETFLELGFERASVDAIAARAGVSKATVYNHFADKAALFLAAFSEGADNMREALQSALVERPEDDIEHALQRAGESLTSVFVSPIALALHRSAAEAMNLPEIRKMFYERGACLTIDTVATYLARQAEKGILSIDDARTAAVHFVMLCHGDLVMKVRLGVIPPPTPEQIAATVRSAVTMFLRAYKA